MANYRMNAREIPLDESYEVVVAGGGPAGCAAAAAAAREGARTLLVEATGALGGMGTSGLVPFWCGYGDGEKIIARGIAEKVLYACRDGMPHVKKAMEKNELATPAIDPELLKRIYDDLVTEAGADVLFHTQLSAVEKGSESEVSTVIFSSKAGLSACSASVYVDCTGDADLAAWAGAEFQKGDETGRMQPVTLCFIISNIDEYALANGPGVHFYDPDSPVHGAIRSEEYDLIIDKHTCNIQLGPGTYGFNTGHVYEVDNTDPASTSRALIAGRKMAAQYHEVFSKGLPAFASSFLTATGSLLGVRETRRVIGDYLLDVEDYQAAASFPDEICRNAFGIDIHFDKETATKLARMPVDEVRKAIYERFQHLGRGRSVGVPYRCLTPRDLRNVLVAGRSISTDRQVNGSTRIMACCLNTGEAAGMAAAHAVRHHESDVHAVDTGRLRERLTEEGAYLPEPEPAAVGR